MVNNYLPLLVILILISALFRDDFSFTLLYLFLGAYALGTWWSRRSLASIKYQREYSNRAFLGETVDVCLQMQNRSWLLCNVNADLSLQTSFNRGTCTLLGVP